LDGSDRANEMEGEQATGEWILPIDDPMKAELAAAEWMRRLGHPTAIADGLPGPDGGIDVEADTAVGQVKHYSNAVGIAEVQRLYGIAQEFDRVPFFFALNGYSRPAVETANRTGVMLFSYTLHGVLEGESSEARTLLESLSSAKADLSDTSYRSPTAGVQGGGRLSDLEVNQLRAKLIGLTTDASFETVESLIGTVDRPLVELENVALRGPFRKAALASPWCSHRAMRQAVEDIGPDSDDLRLVVAKNLRCPRALLEAMSAADPNAEVRQCATKNYALPIEIAARALGDPMPMVRGAVALRTDVAPSHLERLARDPDATCRAAVARSPRCPKDLLVVLATDEHHGVRKHVAARQGIPEDLITRFLHDPDHRVQIAATQNPSARSHRATQAIIDERAEEQRSQDDSRARRRLWLVAAGVGIYVALLAWARSASATSWDATLAYGGLQLFGVVGLFLIVVVSLGVVVVQRRAPSGSKQSFMDTARELMREPTSTAESSTPTGSERSFVSRVQNEFWAWLASSDRSTCSHRDATVFGMPLPTSQQPA